MMLRLFMQIVKVIYNMHKGALDTEAEDKPPISCVRRSARPFDGSLLPAERVRPSRVAISRLPYALTSFRNQS